MGKSSTAESLKLRDELRKSGEHEQRTKEAQAQGCGVGEGGQELCLRAHGAGAKGDERAGKGARGSLAATARDLPERRSATPRGARRDG